MLSSKKKLEFNTRIVFLMILIAITVFYYFHLFVNRARVTVNIKSDATSRFRIYWADERQNYNEKRSVSARINPRKSTYTFFLSNLKSIRKLRIDPLQRPAKVIIKSIEIKQIGYDPVRIVSIDDYKNLVPVNDIEKINIHRNGLDVFSSGIDPQLELRINPSVRDIAYFPATMKFLLVIAFVSLFLFIIDRVSDGYGYIPYCMAFTAALILCMSVVSRDNQHPDEYVHVRAAAYYEDHWIPPEICAPGTKNTYSPYGISRLNTFETVYFFAGKFSSLLFFLPIGSYLKFRFFNFFLYFILLLLCVKSVEYRIFCLPILISPQVWYIFSYFNSDAFALFITCIVSYQLLTKDSLTRRFLIEKQKYLMVIDTLLLGLLLSLLLFLKKNFYIFIAYISVYLFMLFLKVIKRDPSEFKTNIYKLVSIVLVGASFFMIRYALDFYANGFHRSEKLQACQEQMAKPKFRPSAKPENKYFGINLKARGLSLKDMLKKYRWVYISFQSAFGVYGYMSIYPSYLYTQIVRFLCGFFLLLVICSIFIKAPIEGKMLSFVFLACGVLLVAASMWRSWTVDLQYQGRYFIPIFVMFGFLLLRAKPYLNKKIVNIPAILMFLMSTYSFLFIGLKNIPKY